MVVTERDVDLGDVQLRIAESGTGRRPLLLVHGFTGAKEDFTPWIDRLADDGWHVVAPDMRGHGASSKPADEAAYTFEIMADDVLRLADALGWDRFVLLGHSMGGMVAQFAARSAPSRLAGLILMDTAHGPLTFIAPELVDGAVSIVRSQGMDAFAAVMANGEGPLHSPAHQRLLDEKPGYAEFGDRKLRASSPAMYAAMAPAFLTTPDRLESLHKLPESLGVLVIVGEEDKALVAPSRRMAEAVGNGTLVIIPDAGHSPQFENPDAWWETLSGYLAAV